MSIKIQRNEAGNCINFFGTEQPTYWNACLSGIVNSSNPDAVDVRNDIRSINAAEDKYEFFGIHYTEFLDAEGNPFASASAVADYITENGNVTSPDFGTYKGEWDASSDFTPPISPQGGDWYFISV